MAESSIHPTDSVILRMGLAPHVEGGSFRELYRDGERPVERPASGVIYYALGAEEHSEFHVLDSDEYWLYHAGSPVELWLVDPDGHLSIQRLGLDVDCEPCVLVKAGVTFGARHIKDKPADSTLISCVTVPEFSYASYRILPQAQITAICPETAQFFQEL